MSASRRHTARTTELIEQGIPFVQATVVRAQCPTSARPGDAAIVLVDGSIEGFIGGQCAEGSVRTAALSLLESEQTLLLRILPDGRAPEVDEEGALTVVNPCLSGGAIEVFLEPMLPAARIAVIGNTPIADAIASFAGAVGLGVVSGVDASIDLRGCLAVVVSSHGRHEPEVLRSALDAGVQFIGLVASTVRGKAVIAELDLSAEESRKIRTPVGIDIGAKTAEEIALSILAEIVRAVRVEGLRPAPVPSQDRPSSAIDPICGMTVTVLHDTPHLHVRDVDYWFCNPGCRARFAEEAGVGT